MSSLWWTYGHSLLCHCGAYWLYFDSFCGSPLISCSRITHNPHTSTLGTAGFVLPLRAIGVSLTGRTSQFLVIGLGVQERIKYIQSGQVKRESFGIFLRNQIKNSQLTWIQSKELVSPKPNMYWARGPGHRLKQLRYWLCHFISLWSELGQGKGFVLP